MAESRPTAPPDIPRGRVRLARNLRRGFFVLVSAIVVAALLGVFGVTEGVVTGTGGGYELEVEYPRVSRGGLAATLTVTVHHPGGFDAPVVLSFRSDYFDSLDVNGVDPEPLSSTSTADREVAFFQPPDTGDEMAVSYDARIQPGVPLKEAEGSVSIVENGRDVLTVVFKTRVWF
ncbi:MAG: hypothetical protein ACRD12_03825 [Acidimicrobiales bacterium]